MAYNSNNSENNVYPIYNLVYHNDLLDLKHKLGALNRFSELTSNFKDLIKNLNMLIPEVELDIETISHNNKNLFNIKIHFSPEKYKSYTNTIDGADYLVIIAELFENSSQYIIDIHKKKRDQDR